MRNENPRERELWCALVLLEGLHERQEIDEEEFLCREIPLLQELGYGALALEG